MPGYASLTDAEVAGLAAHLRRTVGGAPAIGNGIFAACGARPRHLPSRPAAVLQALAHR